MLSSVVPGHLIDTFASRKRLLRRSAFGSAFGIALAAHGLEPWIALAWPYELTATALGLFVLVAVAAMCGHGVLSLLDVISNAALPAERVRGECIVWGIWLAAVLCAVAAWPAAMHPDASPLGSFLLVGVLLAAPVALAARTPLESHARKLAEWHRWLIAAGGLLWITYVIVATLITTRPLIEGVDFYCYACYARDLANGATDVPAARYRYFPGVYTFWRTAMQLAGTQLESLQWTYLGLLGVNAGLVGLLVGRVGHSAPLGVWSGLLYFALCSHCEGFYGSTEPLCTVPVMTAMLIWGGGPLRGQVGRLHATALGVGLGLGVFAKQQGGLMALGFAALVLACFGSTKERRHDWLALALVPFIAALTFAVAVLFEGDALRRLAVGTDMAMTYDVRGGLVSNLLSVARRAPPLAALTLIALMTHMVLLLEPRLRPQLSEPWAAIAGFALYGALATLAQFSKRAYGHYALLTLPLIIIAGALCAATLARRLPRALCDHPLTECFALFLLALPFVQPSPGYAASLHAWPLHFTMPALRERPWRDDPRIAADIALLRTHLKQGQDVLILPPGRNELHYALGTRSVSFQAGYGWYIASELMEQALASPNLDTILSINKAFLHPNDVPTWIGYGCDAIIDGLEKRRFSKAVDLETLTLWHRESRVGP